MKTFVVKKRNSEDYPKYNLIKLKYLLLRNIVKTVNNIENLFSIELKSPAKSKLKDMSSVFEEMQWFDRVSGYMRIF